MRLLKSKESPIIHQFGDRKIVLSPLLLAMVLDEIIQRLTKKKKFPTEESLEQIILNQYTYLKIKKEGNK